MTVIAHHHEKMSFLHRFSNDFVEGDEKTTKMMLMMKKTMKMMLMMKKTMKMMLMMKKTMKMMLILKSHLRASHSGPGRTGKTEVLLEILCFGLL